MPDKASGPKKARWTSAQKSEARKAPKKAHHRGQPDGPKSAPKRAARSDSDWNGTFETKRDLEEAHYPSHKAYHGFPGGGQVEPRDFRGDWP